ncbi:MAG: hypothetical protein AAB498_01290 [Patescibacteria group bacterium]
MNKKTSARIIIGIVLVVAAVGVDWWQRGDALLTQSPFETEASEFQENIQDFVIENFGQPIDSGFTAPMYLQEFSGLAESDFDGVKTSEGKYEYLGGTLVFIRAQTKFEEAILEKGHKTLLKNLRSRLGNDLSVNEIVMRITNDAGTPLVSVGDVLGAMKVVSVAPFNSGQYSTDPKMMKIGPRNIRITLQGPIEITGAYSAVHSEIGFDGYCMLVSDVVSLARLPVLPVRGGPPDIRSYFCFRNAGRARQKLGEESRTVTVKIDNYELRAYPAEVVDWVDLVEVVGE